MQPCMLVISSSVRAVQLRSRANLVTEMNELIVRFNAFTFRHVASTVIDDTSYHITIDLKLHPRFANRIKIIPMMHLATVSASKLIHPCLRQGDNLTWQNRGHCRPIAVLSPTHSWNYLYPIGKAWMKFQVDSNVI